MFLFLFLSDDVDDDRGGADISLKGPDSVCTFLSDDTACDRLCAGVTEAIGGSSDVARSDEMMG